MPGWRTTSSPRPTDEPAVPRVMPARSRARGTVGAADHGDKVGLQRRQALHRRPQLGGHLVIFMGRLKSVHGNLGARVAAPGDAPGTRRMRQSVEILRASVSDPIRPVSPAQGAGKPLWRGPGREKYTAAALY